ncbi:MULTISPECIES: ornithine cyclodeaminase family protein [unclassified Sphingobium]|uniref:ornithine cyclodeaminase family protein n=1 Tax=unclassified Sphingobium TaxID=2611147 RepID=UPI0035A63820
MNKAESQILVVDAATVAEALSPAEWIEVVEQSLRGVSGGAVRQDVRQILPLPDVQDRGRVLSMMFGAVREPACFGAKVISVFPDNFGRGLDSHRGAVLLFDADDGALVALLHGGEITAARTAAASAVATRALARQDSQILTILGYGEQALRHVDAIKMVRPIEEVRCWGRDPVKATAFSEAVAARYAVRAFSTPAVADAVAGSDIVCTTTAAKTPIMFGDMLEPGMHLNIVGSSTADYREIDTAAVVRSSLWVDYRAMIDVSAGEYLHALADGAIDTTHIIGEIGSALNGAVRGRENAHEITMFKSLGMPAEDLYPAQRIYEVACAKGLGTRVKL